METETSANINPQQSNPQTQAVANSGMNKLADTAAQFGGNPSVGGSSGYSAFLESDASFASATPSANVMFSNSTVDSSTAKTPDVQANQNSPAPSLNFGANSSTSVLPSTTTMQTQPFTLAASSPTSAAYTSGLTNFAPTASISSKRKKPSSATKQHQLPMFLTKTFHMIDRCDPEISTWSEAGDNFVVKNVEKFASAILPQYFKHSNFSSFARQLNFYGFRKLKAEPILTADYDARTASHVRFYHEHFQKGKPELLCHIKRATKSDVQSKDDVEQLRVELHQAIELMNNMSMEFDRKLTEITFDMNSKIAALHGKIAERDRQIAAQDRQIAASMNTMAAGQQFMQQVQQQQVQQTQQQQQGQTSQPQQPPSQPQRRVQINTHPQQVVHQPSQQQTATSSAQNKGSGINGLISAGLAIKSPALPPQQAKIEGISNDQMKLTPAQNGSV